jgi:hypothetical protein
MENLFKSEHNAAGTSSQAFAATDAESGSDAN